jgi:gliding motility-associated-like protein
MNDEYTGQLLFMASATAAVTKNGTFMTNGLALKGKLTADQGVLAIKRPGSTNRYYLFTADATYQNNLGIHYHEIDTSAQGGLGAIILKNQILGPGTTTEKQTAIRHCNGVDYWIITHVFNSNTFNAYLVDSAGVHTSPIASNTGTVQSCLSGVISGGLSLCYEGMGYLEASPNGKKLALVINSDSLPVMEIFDFDNATGIVSNPTTLHYPGSGPYGVSFSPDSKKLYTCPFLGDTLNTLYQYDVSTSVPANIIASQAVIYQTSINNAIGNLCAMQMGPEGKIYIVRQSLDTMAVIGNPNAPGVNCNFQLNGLALAPGTNAIIGLPNIVDANYAGIQFPAGLTDLKRCNSFQPDTLDAGSGFTNYYWSTGAGTQTIVVNNPGTYWVTVTNDLGCTRTDTIHTYLISPRQKNITVCFADTENTQIGTGLNYVWSDGSSNPVKTFTVSGTYWEDVSYSGGCSIRNTFDVTVIPSAEIKFPNIVTPNQDNINDWIDFDQYKLSELQLNVFNRWGQKVFESSDPSVVWKPEVTDGTYFYCALYKIDCQEAKAKEVKGFITIVR